MFLRLHFEITKLNISKCTSSNSFFVDALRFFIFRRLSSANRDSVSPSFQSGCLLVSSYPIALARTSSAVLNRSSNSGHPCLVLDLKGETIQSYNINYNVSCGVFVDVFYQGEGNSFYF